MVNFISHTPMRFYSRSPLRTSFRIPAFSPVHPNPQGTGRRAIACPAVFCGYTAMWPLCCPERCQRPCGIHPAQEPPQSHAARPGRTGRRMGSPGSGNQPKRTLLHPAAVRGKGNNIRSLSHSHSHSLSHSLSRLLFALALFLLSVCFRFAWTFRRIFQPLLYACLHPDLVCIVQKRWRRHRWRHKRHIGRPCF